MTYNPITAGSVASSAYMNAALQAAVIRVADATALAATLAHANPPATDAWLFQTDTEVIKKRTGSGFTDLLDVRRTRGLAAPDLDFLDSAGTEQGTIRAAVATSLSTFTFLNPAGIPFGSIAQQSTAGIRLAQIRKPLCQHQQRHRVEYEHGLDDYGHERHLLVFR